MIAAAIVLPIALSGGLYLVDLPAHMFRAQLIVDILRGAPSKFYDFDLTIVPNMPIDVLAVVARGVIDPAHVVVLLACLACALFYFSVVYWRASCGRPTSIWTALLVVLCLYSWPLAIGLVNYILALGLMNFALMRQERNGDGASVRYGATQTALLVLIYLCSVFPVVLYFAYSFGVFLFDAVRAKGEARLRLIAMSAAIHVPAIALIGSLIVIWPSSPPLVSTPSFVWLLTKKFNGLLSLGRMSNLPPELLVPFAILLAIGIFLWAGRFRIDRRPLIGLLALIGCFLLAPSTVMKVEVIDARMPMAILAIFLSVVREGPTETRAAALAKALIVFAFAIRITSLPVTWHAIAGVGQSYADVARKVEPGSAVLFVYEDPGAALRLWKHALTTGEAPSLATPGVAMEMWHLHAYYFRGRDIYLNNVFENFSIHRKPNLPFGRDSPLASALARDPYDYVLSHIDLAAQEIAGKRLCLVGKNGEVWLYRVHARGADGETPVCRAPTP